MGSALGHCLLLVLLVICLRTHGPAQAADNSRQTVLHGAWLVEGDGLLGGVEPASPTGGSFELHLLEAIGRRAGLGFSLHRMDPDDAASAFAEGTLDFALPALQHEVPADGGMLSRPYAARTDVLLCRPNLPPVGAEGVAALQGVLGRGWRIAVSAGKSYGVEPDAILAAGHDRGFVRWVRGNLDLVEIMMSGEAQCLLAPRLELMAAVTRRSPGVVFIAHQHFILNEVRPQILFNAATVDPATIAAIDRALLDLQEDGTAAALRKRAVLPTLVAFAVGTPWFAWFDIIGTVAFALSGVLIARAEGFSLLGAFVLAALPAVGGGVVRDLLVGREPIGILASQLPLLLVIGTVGTAYVLYALHDRLEASGRRVAHRLFGAVRWPKLLSFGNLLEFTDAIGLATFTVLGVVVAVGAGAEPLWLWGPICAAISGAGGGILRDILRVGYNNPALRTSFYAEVCLCWGFLLSLAILHLLTEDDAALLRISIVVTVLGALGTRLLLVAFKVRSPRF